MPKSRQKQYEDSVARWSETANKALAGKRILGARYMTEDEVKALGWGQSVLVLLLDDGSLLYPSMDDEGNDGGAMFGQTKGGDELGFPVIRNYG